MNRTITVNGVVYPAKDFDYNLICDFDEMGISLEDIGSKPMSVLRAYVSACMNKDRDFAGQQLEEHIISGGNFDEIMNAMSAKIEESRFFRHFAKTPKTEVGAEPKKTTKKKITE